MGRRSEPRVIHVVTIGALACAAALAACNALLGNDERGLDEDGGTGGKVDGSTRDESSPSLDGTTTIEGGQTNDGDAPDGGSGADADATAPLVGCLGDAGCERVMFVTTQSFTGNLGGVAGADAKCQAAGDKSTLARVEGHAFMAWVSTSGVAARDRHVHGIQKYVRANGVQTIANDFDDLVCNGPKVPIANEQDNISDKGAWTGTRNNGDKVAATCADWTMTTGTTGLTGNPDQPATWSEDAPAIDCAQTAILICIER